MAMNAKRSSPTLQHYAHCFGFSSTVMRLLLCNHPFAYTHHLNMVEEFECLYEPGSCAPGRLPKA